MPTYKVLSKGFINGRLYDPEGKRSEVHTDSPLRPVPTWLKELHADETPAQRKAREQAEAKSKREAAAKAKEDKIAIDSVTFTEAPKTSGVETL